MVIIVVLFSVSAFFYTMNWLDNYRTLSIEEIESYATKIFSQIPNKNIKELDYREIPAYPEKQR